MALPLIRGRTGDEPLAARAGIAAGTAFLVASTFDFLWHLIAIPALLGLILGCAVRVIPRPSTQPDPPLDLIPVPQHDEGTPRHTEGSRQ